MQIKAMNTRVVNLHTPLHDELHTAPLEKPQRSLAEPTPYAACILFRGTNKAGEPHMFVVPRRPVDSDQFPYLLLSHHGDKYPHTDWVGWESVLDRVRVEFGGLENVSKVEAL